MTISINALKYLQKSVPNILAFNLHWMFPSLTCPCSNTPPEHLFLLKVKKTAKRVPIIDTAPEFSVLNLLKDSETEQKRQVLHTPLTNNLQCIRMQVFGAYFFSLLFAVLKIFLLLIQLLGIFFRPFLKFPICHITLRSNTWPCKSFDISFLSKFVGFNYRIQAKSNWTEAFV